MSDEIKKPAPEAAKPEGLYFDRPPTPPGKRRLGPEDLPPPKGVGYIQTRWDLCVGCGMCEMACSSGHFGEMNRELSRIRIYRYLIPIPKSVQNVCAQCSSRERECQKACPLNPPAISYDDQKFHVVVDAARCASSGCHQECRQGCPAQVPHPSPNGKSVIMCDLCEEQGERHPRCVGVCPYYALEFAAPRFPQHLDRNHPDEKAEALARRLYPLRKDQIQLQPEELWREK